MMPDDLTPAEFAAVSLLAEEFGNQGIRVDVGGPSSSRVVRGHVPGKVQEFWIDLRGGEPVVSMIAQRASSTFLARFSTVLDRCVCVYRDRRGCL
jgi:hypothetical protein